MKRRRFLQLSVFAVPAKALAQAWPSLRSSTPGTSPPELEVLAKRGPWPNLGLLDLRENQIDHALRDRLRRKFNVAVAETGYLELWQRAELAAVSVNGTRTILESELEAISRELEEYFPSELLGTRFELIE